MYLKNKTHPIKNIKTWLLLWIIALSLSSWKSFCLEDCKDGFSDSIKTLSLSIRILPLPNHLQTFLHNKRIYYIGDLVTKTEEELTPLMGSQYLSEIQAWLSEKNLHLGMDVRWPISRRQINKLEKTALSPFFAYPIESLGLFSFLIKTLQEKGIFYVGDLVTKTEMELTQKGPRLNSEALSHLKYHLSERGLYLGMNIDWPTSQKRKAALVKKLHPPMEVTPILFQSISRLNLSFQTSKGLEMKKVRSIGDLVKLTEWDIQPILYFTTDSLPEIKAKLAEKGLRLEMNINWPVNQRRNAY